ncbi:Histidine phosphatase superfamily clade-1 [Macrophomina phaseolina MS6]|uniref:Histidine phosphatase superfamily clade-1 n=1 Tax=Macrophomina phaseolina (strain MS6) TaxID=1126212 RepID=K2SR78_MACPH|nr:Histidine phosphatase superfamily clade-1 [Macrophomina phaseolina MS6]
MPPFPLDTRRSPFERANAYKKSALEEWEENSQYCGQDICVALKLVEARLRDETSDDKSAPLSTVVFELRITPDLCTPEGSVHGGVVPLIFDITTSSAINAAAKPGFWDNSHSSRTLSCSYLRPVKMGETVLIESELVALGKRSALTRGVMRKKGRNGQKGEACYTCEHDKVNTGNPPKI